ncbi:MAG TPA: C40 family peptidase [Thermoanaerobaculia bacterium]
MKKSFAVILILTLAVPLAAETVATADAEPQGVISQALSWIGVKYRFGSADERRGFDCAGLVRRVFSSVGIQLPRTAADQYSIGEEVERSELSPGDLVFFRNTYKRGISHVGIYVGENQFVHAANSRRSVVVDELDTPYYLSRFAGGRRLLAEPDPVAVTSAGDDVSMFAPPPIGPEP